MEKAKKGQRIECTFKGETKYGVVSKGGKNKITVVLDGGVTELKGHVSLFRTSDKPLPKDKPSVMDKWEVKKYKEIKGHGDTPTFEAAICLNGKPVIQAMNDGWGGPNMYYGDFEVVKQFENDASEWAKTFGCKNATEMDGIWIEWYVFKRPYGVTAEQELAEFNKMMSGFENA